MIKLFLAFVSGFIGAYIMVLARVLLAYLVAPMAALAWNTGVVSAFGAPCVTGKEVFCVLVLLSVPLMFRKF